MYISCHRITYEGHKSLEKIHNFFTDTYFYLFWSDSITIHFTLYLYPQSERVTKTVKVYPTKVVL